MLCPLCAEPLLAEEGAPQPQLTYVAWYDVFFRVWLILCHLECWRENVIAAVGGA